VTRQRSTRCRLHMGVVPVLATGRLQSNALRQPGIGADP